MAANSIRWKMCWILRHIFRHFRLIQSLKSDKNGYDTSFVCLFKARACWHKKVFFMWIFVTRGSPTGDFHNFFLNLNVRAAWVNTKIFLIYWWPNMHVKFSKIYLESWIVWFCPFFARIFHTFWVKFSMATEWSKIDESTICTLG